MKLNYGDIDARWQVEVGTDGGLGRGCYFWGFLEGFLVAFFFRWIVFLFLKRRLAAFR